MLMQCLSGTAAEEAWSQDRWGMAAGLTAPQRLALVWEERLHGARPDVTKAGQLIGWDWMRKLRHLHEQRLTLDEITRAIGGTTPQHLVTTRLALWWLDLDGTRAQLRADGELTPKWQRVADAHGPEIARVLKAGGNRFDVSAYLGVSVSCAEKAITFVNKSMVAALEVAA
ncbi:hypothetical protein VO63_20205 [Streptomyces showdoensis]|uniref:Uncharacterized protein n=1 Tax=Streptomyces showdoensis TaxID=68268 RepID=A0A2P2GKQ9_STREW|nr:hypothetical protein VO63_20205 [Streptomyces showdoensis]